MFAGMSLKGTQPLRVRGSRAALRPTACKICCARPRHGAASGLDKNARASDGSNPEGRKKLTKAAETHGCPSRGPGFVFTPQGAPLEPTSRGPFGLFAAAAPAATATL